MTGNLCRDFTVIIDNDSFIVQRIEQKFPKL